MELRRYFRLLRQRILIVILTVIAGAAGGYLTTSRTPTYTATTVVYVGSANLTGAGAANLYLEAGLNEVVATFASMIPSPVIAQKAINSTHLDRFAGEVAGATLATVVTGTNLISVSVTDPSAADAVALANGVSRAFVAQVYSYQCTTTSATTSTCAKPSAGTLPNEPAYVFQPASIAVRNSTGLTKDLLLGSIFGLVIAIFVILLLDYLDITIKSPEELERRVGLPVLGIIPLFGTLPLGASPGTGLQRPATGALNG